ncbi:sensor histidine kinase [Chryseobacterium taiwanense]|uniref:Histidine kinase n=1 Tax=Chryseobacterium taiwanense TaxID=363331 RepID=A0A0B4CY00_9FLAO|nr:histidine kinase [Chryseobacterium taiwanense]KIC61227.1 histidine kinase [Chryseobacterium taiwanense]
MQIKLNQNEFISNQNTLLEFEKFYNKSPKIIFHFLMWFVCSALLFLNYHLEFGVSVFDSFILTLRNAINNAVVFYSFFYLFVPFIISKKRGISVLLFLISIPFCIYIWLSVNYFIFCLYHYLGYEIDHERFKNIISQNASQSYLQAIKFETVLSNAMIVIYTLSPFFFVKIVFEIVRIYNKAIQLQEQKLEVEIQNINIEKDFLKSQLNPHFLFNTLNNLYGLSVKKDDTAPEVILNLSDIMSYTLYESNTEKVALEKEIDFIKNYFELEKMRYPKDKNIELKIFAENDFSGLYIAPLMTFTFIENAFKYGLRSSQNQYIKQEIEIKNNTFYFVLENDIDKTENRKEWGGIGLENIKKRLHLLYPNQHILNIQTLENSFRVELKINL